MAAAMAAAARRDKMRLRPAVPEDAAPLAALSIEVWLGTYLKHGINAHFAEYVLGELTAEKLAATLKSEGEQVFVSEGRDGIDGFIRLSYPRPAPDGIAANCEISTFYVRPNAQGKGRGRALLGHALEHVPEGACGLWLTTNSENTPAIGFYLSQGFVKAGETVFRIGADAYPNDIYLLNSG